MIVVVQCTAIVEQRLIPPNLKASNNPVNNSRPAVDNGIS